MSFCREFNVLHLTNLHSQKYDLISMDDDPRASRMPSKLIHFIDDYDKRDNNYDIINHLACNHVAQVDRSSRATIDRALDNFLSISDDMDAVISQSGKTFAIELLGEKTLKAGKFGQPVMNFYAPIKIGEPPKTYRIQFDLTTNDIFVPHYELMQQLRRKIGLKTILRNDQSYRCKKSETGRKIDSKRQRGIDFQGLRLEGKMYEDSMQLSVLYQDSNQLNNQYQQKPSTYLDLDDGQTSNISIFQHFVAVKNSVKQKSNLSKLPVHGYLGLGPRQRSPTGIKSFLLNLLDDGHIERLQFSLWFNKWTPSATLVLGGVQRDKFSEPIEWHSSDANEWSLEIERVELGRNLISSYRGFLPRASINLGVHEIYGPKEAIKRIHQNLGVDRSTKLPLVDSTTIALLPTLIIYINDLAYKIEPRHYIRWCQKGAYVALLPSKNNRWILGSIFLESRYTIFDVDRLKIGFGRLSQNLTHSDLSHEA